MSPSPVASPSPATDALPALPAHNAPADVPPKISAYYSLVFPNITFFLQTLTVTIGRRCLPPTSASLDGPSSTQSPVDVDLGPLKSVSRLHARIEYEEEEARFVLVVIGRNGAWVDGVWSGAGSRVPLGERSQIQIASRTFHFVLPPPVALEDSPSPSSVSSVQRARSPSVDITSISPPSSLPSHSPSPRVQPLLPPPKPPRSPDPQLPNSNAITRTKAPCASTSLSTPATSTSKKRKKASNPPPKPDVMPPKPSFTYAQLCYRAIKTMGGKATLQDICGWMVDNYDWYRYNEGAGWENSVRHNLSSGRAFKKMERSTGEHGKGFFWSIDPQCERTFQEQEARAAALAQAQSTVSSALSTGGKDGGSKGSRKKDKAVPLDPPLKRSVKSGVGPLPPPLTSTPLVFPPRSASDCRTQAPSPGQLFTSVPTVAVMAGNPGDTPQDTKSGPDDSSQFGSTSGAGGLLGSFASSGSSSGMSSATTPSASMLISTTSGCNPSSSSSGSVSPFTALPPSVCLPIVVGPVPSTHPASSSAEPPPIVLHNNTLVLSPAIFSSLALEQLKALEEMGAQKALEVLQAHIVRYLKERMSKKKRKKATTDGVAEKGGMKAGKVDTLERSSPFTTVPLPLRTAQSTPTSQASSQGSLAPRPLAQVPDTETTCSNLLGFRTRTTELPAVGVTEGVPSSVNTSPPVPVPVPVSADSRSQTPTIVAVDEDDEEGRATKRRKLGNEVEVELLKHQETVRVSQDVDEDIEVDVC